MAKSNSRIPAPGRKTVRMPQVPEGQFGRELDARRLERVQAADKLRQSRTPLAVIDVAASATAVADQFLEEAMRAHRPPALACQEGCDWCCYLNVGTAVPEVARIVEYLKGTLTSAQMRELRERVVQLDEWRRQQRTARQAVPPLPCALLVDHKCIAYPVRPLTCRGCNSTNARKCEQFLDPRNKTSIPMYVPQHRLTTFVLDGMRAGTAEAGLKGDLIRLTPALRIALEIPDAIERWLAGEPVFDPASAD